MTTKESKILEQRGCKMDYPYLLDFLTDNVMSRSLSMLISFLIFAFTVFVIVGSSDPILPSPYSVSFEKNPFLSMPIGTIASQLLTPLVRVLDADGNPSVGVNATLVVQDILTQTTISSLICDREYRESISGTIEYLRFAEVCHIILENETAVTDSLGQARFPDFMIRRGPQGIYDLSCQVNNQVITKTLSETVTSTAIKIKILNDINEMRNKNYGESGQPLNINPKIQVLDCFGNPLADKIVVAFPWPEPFFDSTPSNTLIDALKFVYFNNSVSLPTDSNGITTFYNLTAIGYTYIVGTYLHFSVDGDVTEPFIEDTGIKDYLRIPVHFFQPILLTTTVKRVIIITPPPSSVMEGQAFDIQPVIQVLDKYNNSIPGKMVFALKATEQGKPMPSLYSIKDPGYETKELLFPIPAIYSESFTDPLKSHMFTPILTNSTGIVNFTNLTFSEKGNAGNNAFGLYNITFVCDGVYSDSVTVQVLSKIGSIKFIEQPPSSILIDPHADTQITPIVQILTHDAVPIQGKLPRNVSIIPVDSRNDGMVKGYVDDEYPAYVATGADGLHIIIYRIAFLKVKNLKVQLSVTFDDITTISNIFELTYNEETLDPNFCTGIDLLNLQTTDFPIVINQPTPFISVYPYNQFGQPIYNSNCSLSFEADFKGIPNSITPFPTNFFSIENLWNSNFDSITGIGNCSQQIISMPKGKIPFLIYIYVTDNCVNQSFYSSNYCISHDILTFSSTTDISTAMINTSYAPTINDFSFNNLVFNIYQTFFLTLTFYQEDGKRYANSPIDVNLIPNQLPPTWLDYLSFLNFTLLSNKTNANGDVNLTLNFFAPAFGLYAFSFAAGSVYTYPLFFRTNLPVGDIQIISQPAVNKSLPHVADIFMTTPIVYVSNTEGLPLANVIVTTVFDNGSGCVNGSTVAILDDFTYGCASNTQITSFVSPYFVISTKMNYTDNNGVAQFNQLGLMDVAGSACVRFRFAVGEPGLVKFSAPSDLVCVINDYTYSVSSTTSSKVAVGQNFGVPALVTIQRESQGSYDLNGYITIRAFARYIDNEEQTDSASSDSVLKNNHCAFNYGHSQDNFCSDLKVVKNDNPMILQTNFTALQWIKPTLSSTIRLEFSSELQTSTAALSKTIEVTSDPTNLDFIVMPPSAVNIGQIFRIQVKATLGDGTPISRAFIDCNATQGIDLSSISSDSRSSLENISIYQDANISRLTSSYKEYLDLLNFNDLSINTRDPQALFKSLDDKIQNLNLSKSQIVELKEAYWGKFLSNVDKQNLMYIMGKGEIGLDSLTSLNKRTNVKLISFSGKTRTESDGTATITLKFNAGTSGEYYLQCQSGQAYTPKSMPIQLNNSISQIKYLNPINQTITLKFRRSSQNEILPTLVSFPRNINISILLDPQTPWTGMINDLQLSLIDYSIVNDAMNNLHSDVSNYSVQEIQLINDFSDNPSVQEKLIKLWNILTSGAAALLNSLESEQGLVTQGVSLDPISNYYQMKNLVIQLNQPGQYQLVISVNGIESERSGVITIVDDPDFGKSPIERVASIILIYVVYFLSVYLAFVNISRSPSIFSVIALGVVIFSIVLVNLEHKNDSTLSIFLFTIFGIMLINLAEIIFVKLFGYEETFSHQFLKENVFIEYTFQRMYHRPSASWRQRIAGNANLNTGNSDLFKLHPEMQLSDSQKSDRPCSAEEKYNIKVENNNPDSPKQSKIKLIIQSIIAICTPFSCYYNKLNVDDAFYFPQRFLNPAIISFVSFAYILSMILVYSQQFFDGLHQLKINVNKVAYTFVNIASSNAFLFNQVFTDADFQPVEDLINTINTQFDEIIDAIQIGFTIALVLSSILFFFSVIYSFFSCKEDILKIRKGIWDYPAEKTNFNMTGALNYNGVLISNFLVGFFVVLITLTLVFAIISYKIIWELLYEYIWVIVVLAAPLVAQIIILLVLRGIIVQDTYVSMRFPFSLLDIVMYFMGIVSNILPSAIRFFIAIGIAAVGIARVDQPILPHWVLKIMWLDSSNSAYISALVMHNNHNHPIYVTIAMKLYQDVKIIPNDPINLKVRNKFQLARLLIKNPDLKKYRIFSKPEPAQEKEPEHELKPGKVPKHSPGKELDPVPKKEFDASQRIELELLPVKESEPEPAPKKNSELSPAQVKDFVAVTVIELTFVAKEKLLIKLP